MFKCQELQKEIFFLNYSNLKLKDKRSLVEGIEKKMNKSEAFYPARAITKIALFHFTAKLAQLKFFSHPPIFTVVQAWGHYTKETARRLRRPQLSVLLRGIQLTFVQRFQQL
jgi:hypothetical protein